VSLEVIVYILTALAVVVVVLTRLRMRQDSGGAGAVHVGEGFVNLHTVAGSIAIVLWLIFLLADKDTALGNEVVGIISDQNAEDMFLPFFGHLAGTNLGAGVIQERTGSPAVPSYCVYLGLGRYRLVFCEPLVPVPDCEVKGEGLLRAMHTWLEGVIREHVAIPKEARDYILKLRQKYNLPIGETK